MNKKDKNTFMERLDTFVSILNKSSIVNSLDCKNDKESYNLAISLIDIEESMEKVTQLKDTFHLNMDESEINDTLWEIGEEFRHIMYHISNSKFYEYLEGSNDG